METLHGGRAVLVGAEPVDFTQLPDNLQVIGCNMTGTDHLPWDYILDNDIRVISLAGEHRFLETVTSTAEHTMLLIGALLRNYHGNFLYPQRARDVGTGHTLAGKTLGIVGYGRVGKQVARIAQAFGMRIIYVDRGGDLGNLLRHSDIVTVHIPLGGNENLFTTYRFSQMQPHAYFVNTSRPGIIKKNALAWAIHRETIAGAAVDFLDPTLQALQDGHNVIVTNHQGGNTHEDREKTARFIREKVDAFLNNQL